jgi:GNAT superfamily N-acetyltransferase
MWQIRKCTAADFDRVTTILRQLWPSRPFDAKRLRPVWDRALASTSQRFICAIDNSEMLGFCSFSMKYSLRSEGQIAHIDELVVTATARGQGIGAGLIEFVIDMAEKSGCNRVEIEGAADSADVAGFCAHAGFEHRAALFTMAL